MPAKEINQLRKIGQLKEALKLAEAELQNTPDNIWAKRNISWVYYDLLKSNNSIEQYQSFISILESIQKLQLPAEETMLFDHLCWQVGKMCFVLNKQTPIDINKCDEIFLIIQKFNFTRPSLGYSYLFKSFHKAFKDTDRYVQFADWWSLNNLRPEDFEKEKLPGGQEVMALAEQAYIAYAKALLKPGTVKLRAKSQNPQGIVSTATIIQRFQIDKQKIQDFLPNLSELIEKYPEYQYPSYFKAKLLLNIGEKADILNELIPFVKKKRNDFWAWEILAEAFAEDPDKVFACYCKGLSCNSPEKMIVTLRQKLARILISRKLYPEAKTEINLLISTKKAHGFKIPDEVANWQTQEWYNTTTELKTNSDLYKKYIYHAESLLFSDTPEETVIVEFVNSDKKIIHFIASESRIGFFKYDRFFKDVKIGDTIKVRFQGGSNEGAHQVYTAVKVNDEVFKKQFLIEFEGKLHIPRDKSFGFVNEIYFHPSQILKQKLESGMLIKGKALKTFNAQKKQWGWKYVEI